MENQTFRNMLPAIGNEFIIIIKDSSPVSMIGIAEIIYTARVVQGITVQPLAPLLAAALYFCNHIYVGQPAYLAGTQAFNIPLTRISTVKLCDSGKSKQES
ncbi:hypothetical protein QP794_32710 [Paenibacillus sp. UMB7766-LJ446]|nr:hypothetical protein [Paenibacillus sp. UMB7766-LJ446]